jgi:hypothetical protein
MRKQPLSPDEAEKIRISAGINTPQAFSIRLGYSHYAYPLAIKNHRLTQRMSDEIRRRFWRHVE